MMQIRGWRADDEPAVDALLDVEPDPLWTAQGHRLHGPPREGERWRRSWVVERDGVVVGAVSLARNSVHSDQYNLAVEVGPDARRQGVGTALVEFARRNRVELLRMSAKVRERDVAGMAMARSMQAVLYLRAPCPVVLGNDPDVAAWCALRSAVETAPLSSVPAAQRARLYADLYRWQHADRVPVRNETALGDMARAMADEADPNLSSVYWAGDEVTAAAFVFAARDSYECVAETIRRDQSEGITHLGAAIARTLTRLAGIGAPVEFDGHDSDPHLAPLVATLPSASTDPLLLVTIDAPRGAGEPLQ